ncbi:MAG: N-acetylneuraminate synthase family protein [Dehalococcoidia bacterium]
MTIIIAEAGENHCGDMEMARQLIELAARSGADYVKFQLYDASQVADDDPEREWFHRVQLSEDRWFELAAYARQVGIAPLATPWDCTKAEAIFQASLDTVKIASFHTVDLELLDFVNQRARRVFLSTGMSSLEEVERAVATLDRVEEFYVLHCVSEYPLPPENVNLRVMDTLRERFGHRARIGYSDHTIGILAPVAAVARGAEVIEKHITLDKSLPGTDHILSADPEELPEMVRQIRLVETMLGQPEKRLTKLESELQTFVRKRFRH